LELDRPLVLTVDGYSGHHSYKLFKWCQENEVILIILYPNSTHILQVCDVAMFSPIKQKYTTLHQGWKLENPEMMFNEVEFVKILKRVNDEAIKKESIVNGWRATGLQPFNFDNVKLDRLIGNKEKIAVLSVKNVKYDVQDSFTSSTLSKLNRENTVELPFTFDEDSGFGPENVESNKIFFCCMKIFPHSYSFQIQMPIILQLRFLLMHLTHQ
jgi:DDE superfamily endonuclease